MRNINLFLTACIAGIGLMIASHGAQAAVLTLDFEEQASGSCAGAGSSFVSQGVQFVSTGGTTSFFACNAGVVGNQTSRAMVEASGQSDFDMTLASGDPFDLLSFDAGSRKGSASLIATGIRLTGFINGGGMVTTDIALNGDLFENFSLTGFLNLASVSWLALNPLASVPNPQFVFDNVVINNAPSAVPVPAAVWLFGTGILGLIGFSKRKATMLKAA